MDERQIFGITPEQRAVLLNSLKAIAQASMDLQVIVLTLPALKFLPPLMTQEQATEAKEST